MARRHVASTGVDMTEARATGALEGWRVLEVADGLAASFCAKVLGDLGADVVKVEPPGGHPSRQLGPAAPRRRSRRAGRPVPVPEHRQGERRRRRRVRTARRQLDVLASACDVVVTDRRPTTVAWANATTTTIVVAITPFGLTGPYAGYRAHHLVTFHAGGEGSILPSGPGWKQFPDRPPIQIGSDIADYDAGWNAAVAVLAAATTGSAPGGVSASTSRCRSRSSRSTAPA